MNMNTDMSMIGLATLNLDTLGLWAEPLTDLGNARRLVRSFGSDIRYLCAAKSWLIWDGRRWVKDDTDQISRYAREIADWMMASIYAPPEFTPQPQTVSPQPQDLEVTQDHGLETTQSVTSCQSRAFTQSHAFTQSLDRQENAAMERRQLAKVRLAWAKKSQSCARLEAMTSLAQAEPGIPVRPASLDADQWLLCTLSGTIELRTGMLRPHRRSDLITRLAPVTYQCSRDYPLSADYPRKDTDQSEENNPLEENDPLEEDGLQAEEDPLGDRYSHGDDDPLGDYSPDEDNLSDEDDPLGDYSSNDLYCPNDFYSPMEALPAGCTSALPRNAPTNPSCSTPADPSCPLWEKMLLRILPDPQVRAFVQRTAGYALTGSTREQCAFFWHGSGRNGKTTTIEALRFALGDYALETPAETLTARSGAVSVPSDLARLAGARLVTARETEDGQKLSESLLKHMTGGDSLTARFLFQEWFEFTPAFTLILATNHRPVIRGTDEGIWRRIFLVPFDQTLAPTEVDQDLPEKLRAEGPGILAWAVRGCLAWQETGLCPPPAVLAATQGYRTDMDAVGQFVAECCDVGSDRSQPAGTLYGAFGAWSRTGGLSPLSPPEFCRRLKERGFQKRRRRDGLVWDGLILLNGDPENSTELQGIEIGELNGGPEN